MTDLARQIVPLEVVCPPIPVNRLSVLNDMVTKLQGAGALGTSDSLIYAFGVHINAELPDLNSQTIVPYLQAYCVSQHWLMKAHRIDTLRRLTPYIDMYPKRYVELLEEYAEQPGNATEIAGIDLYQVLAGAPSGVTHVAVISAEKRYQFMERYNSPEFAKYLRKFASVREVLGVNYADNISFSGGLSIDTLRQE